MTSDKLKWYIVHVYSGFENKVKKSLEERIASSSHPEKFDEIIVPTEQIVELVKGKENIIPQILSRIHSCPLTT